MGPTPSKADSGIFNDLPGATAIAVLALPDATVVYLACAALGGTVLAIQLLLVLVGGDVVDGDMDLDVDADGLSLFSIRAVAAFLTFFGLVGVYGLKEEWGAAATAGSASGAGFGMMVVVAWIFSLQRIGLPNEVSTRSPP